MKKQNRNVVNEIAEKVIKMMETSGTDWIKPWSGHIAENGMPRSAVGRRYTGLNYLNLSVTAWENVWADPIYATFKQWQSIGANVKKGEKGTAVVFYKQITVEDKDFPGTETTIPMLKHFSVFNIDQVEGADGLRPDPQDIPNDQTWDDNLTAEDVLIRSEARIEHKAGDRAFFSGKHDCIVLPLKQQFQDSGSYYATALHELTHWSGHESRLDRKFGKRFGDSAYAFEELVAELGSAMLCCLTGVSVEPREDHAKYLNSWIKEIKDDSKKLLTACSMAEKAATYLMDLASQETTKEKAA